MRADFGLSGQRILVTGTSGGIGGAIAEGVGIAGAEVVCSARTASQAEGAAERLVRLGCSAVPLALDLSRSEGCESAFQSAVDSHGPIDGLVNVAGVQLRKPALDVTPAEFQRMVAVNLEATFFMCQAAGRHLASHGGGTIVNVTSLTALFGIPNLSVYAATRGGGVNQLTRALAVEWAALGIRVNAIAPGRVRTPMTEDVFADRKRRESFERNIPMGRGGRPDDIAGAAVFLLSPASSYITGHTLPVDGGWSASGSLGG